MAELNLPWVESIYFEEELAKRPHLSPAEKEDAAFYHENGYLILPALVKDALANKVLSHLQSDFDHLFSREVPRARDLWEKSEAVRELAINSAIASKLEMFYERKPIPFQTINFKYGSRQNPHSDSVHFSSFPERYMCGAWTALEDMDENNGTLVYYPGSHKMGSPDFNLFSKEFNPTNFDTYNDFYKANYEPFIKEMLRQSGREPKVLTIKKGDVLIWSSNLIHGGLPIRDENRTRWSQVTHFFFEDCLYYTPQLSNTLSGEWFLREITNIATGKKSMGNYNGFKPFKTRIDHRYTLSGRRPENFNPLKFLKSFFK